MWKVLAAHVGGRRFTVRVNPITRSNPGETSMTDQDRTGSGPHMPAADRRTLQAIFHHPVPHNLSWMDTLRLLTHLGSAEEKQHASIR